MTNAMPVVATSAETEWFRRARFGMFIHWGLYALPARHEWIKNRELMSEEEYQAYFDRFNPDLYDPDAWADAAWEAGMRYFVITAKHHEGFCLWDSDLTEYKSTRTPCGRDLLAPMVEAFRRRGMGVGLYYSLLDWHHPEFPIDGHHPMRENQDFIQSQRRRDIRKYADYLHGQVRELLTRFGRIDIMWCDFSYAEQDWGWSKGKGREDWQSEKLVRTIRELQPHIILNDRLEVDGDIKTPEQYQPEQCIAVEGKPVLWEACQTMNGSWGYDRDNLDWKSPEMLIRMLIDSVSKDGNILLNVGPNARGELEPRTLTTLRAIGEWMRLHERSIRGCGACEWAPPPDARFTRCGDRLYLHLFTWPFRFVHLKGMADRIAYAQLLNDASEIRIVRHGPTKVLTHMKARVKPGDLALELPVQKPDVAVPVIELFLKE